MLWVDKKDLFIHLSTDQWETKKKQNKTALMSLDFDSEFLHINNAFNQ